MIDSSSISDHLVSFCENSEIENLKNSHLYDWYLHYLLNIWKSTDIEFDEKAKIRGELNRLGQEVISVCKDNQYILELRESGSLFSTENINAENDSQKIGNKKDKPVQLFDIIKEIVREEYYALDEKIDTLQELAYQNDDDIKKHVAEIAKLKRHSFEKKQSVEEVEEREELKKIINDCKNELMDLNLLYKGMRAELQEMRNACQKTS